MVPYHADWTAHECSNLRSFYQSISALAELKNIHSDVQMDAVRDKGFVYLRGLPENVARAKEELLHMEMTSNKRTVSGKEAGLLVGKRGVTVNRLVEEHDVAIDIDETGDDVWTATIVGPAEKVESACQEIDGLMEANRDCTFEVPVDQIVRNTLLTDSGAPIKKLQKDINAKVTNKGTIFLSLSKNSGAACNLLIRGRLGVVAEAKAYVEEAVKQINDSLVTIDVDPFVIPKLIGKGGETIKKMKNGTSVNIEVNKKAGRVVIQCQDAGEVQRVAQEVEKILHENQLLRIDYDPALVKKVFMNFLRSKQKEEMGNIVWLGMDDSAGHIVLRGTPENVSPLCEIG